MSEKKKTRKAKVSAKRSRKSLPPRDSAKPHWGVANNIGQAFADALNKAVKEKG